MDMVRWVIAAVLALMSLFVLVGNPVAGFQAERAGRHYSAIPFVGGILGGVACVTCPAIGLSWWVVVPIALDYTVAGFFYVLIRAGLTR
jgi:hypothetical protein